MSAYYRFPEYKLASGRYILIEIFTQDVSAGIAAPYTDPAGRIDLTHNPWLQGGVPLADQAASPELGILSSDAADFSFYGGPLYDGKCLYCLIMEQPPDQYLWNIRYYTKPNAAATYSLRPQFWGLIKRATVDGDLLSVTRHELNKYKLTAENRVGLFDRVMISDWSIDWKTAPLAILPAAIYIDGLQLNNVLFSVPGSDPGWIISGYLRFLSIRDMLETMAANVALATTINKIDSVLSSWVFYGKDGSGVEHEYTFDDLVFISGTEIPPGHPKYAPNWYWHWSYFDHEKAMKFSVYQVNSLMQLLKQFLVPFGLTASIDVWHRTGESFLAIREVESRAGIVLRKLLREKKLTAGENSIRGITINVAEDGELSMNGTDGEQIDLCFMSATRLRAGERWTHQTGGVPDHDTDDLPCLFGSLYVYDATGNFVSNVTKIAVKSDGRDTTTVSPASVSLHNGGKMIAEACARYWFNNQNTTASRLGYYRREMQQLECRAFEIRDDIEGTVTGVATGKLVDAGKFVDDGDTYLYRRVRNQNSGAETVITAKDSDNQLSLADDVINFVTDPYVILGPRVDDFAEDAAGYRWRIMNLAVNDREGTSDFVLEGECYG